jgi:glycine betaine/proline transport system substrate-binding protein
MTSITTSVLHRRGALQALVAALALACVMLVSGCGSTAGGSFASSAKTGPTSVSLLSEPWDDLETENVIAQQLLDKLGYQVSIASLAVDVGAKSMETGKIDGYLGNWWPSQQATFGSVINSGKVKVLGTLLTGTQYAPAVPGVFASKYHISSLADLAKYGNEFGHKIYGIEPGTPGNATIQKMIKANDYGLGSWTMVPSSTPAMLAQVQRSINQNKPIAFLAWSPHWMTVQYHPVFLQDPKGVWGGAGEIRTLINTATAQKSPNVAKFLGNLKFTTTEAGQFYYQHDKQHQSFDSIAAAWIAKNPDVVKQFLNGVKSTSGKSAESVVFGS